jgi:hypothetical protein
MWDLIENVFEFFFDKVGGKLILAGALLASLLTWFIHDQRSIGARNAIADANASAQELVHKVDEAGRAAEQPGAVERLRKHYCRDC